MSFVLDSTLLIDFGNDFQPSVEMVDWLFSQPRPLFVCDVITCEVLSRGDERQLRALENLLTALDYVAVDPEGARWAAASRREGKASPGQRSLADALIGAIAWRTGSTVVTRNPRDFERMGIPVLHYGEQHLRGTGINSVELGERIPRR